jgi:hypothetical protein
VQQINTTVTTKIEQVGQASDAIQSAYSGIVDAKKKIENITQ